MPPRPIFIMELLVGPEAHLWPGGRRSQSSEWAARCRLPAINVRQDWSATSHLTEDPIPELTTEALAREFPNLRPTGVYELTNQYLGRTWAQHVWEVRQLLLRLRNSRFANNFGLQAMLGVLGEGNERLIAMQEFIMVQNTTPWRNGSGEHADPRLDAADELVDADLPGTAETDRIRGLLYSHRWVATFFNFNQAHWVAAIFDQALCTLTLYDTVDQGRDRRAKAAGLAWRSFALNLGLPCIIRIVSAPLPQQPNDWACGYIGLVNLLLATRCLEGTPYTRLPATEFPRQYIHADARPDNYAKMPKLAAPFFPLPDWTYGADNSEEGWRRASTMLHAMMANELGIRSLNDLQRHLRHGKPTLGPYHFHFDKPSPGDLVALHIPNSQEWRAKPPRYEPLYSGRAPVLMGFLLPPTDPKPPPIQWPPFRDYIYRNLPGEVGSVGVLCKGYVRCWDQGSNRFAAEHLAREAQRSHAAISISSGTRKHGGPDDAISVSSGMPGE